MVGDPAGKRRGGERGPTCEQVIEGLKANITVLEAKLRETEDAVHRKDVASQKMEESLGTRSAIYKVW